MRHAASSVAALVVTLAVAACSSSPAGASASCSSTADCQTGLECLGMATFSDAGCTEGPKACSRACATDGDCVQLGAGYKCFAGCGTSRFCGATQ